MRTARRHLSRHVAAPWNDRCRSGNPCRVRMCGTWGTFGTTIYSLGENREFNNGSSPNQMRYVGRTSKKNVVFPPRTEIGAERAPGAAKSCLARLCWSGTSTTQVPKVPKTNTGASLLRFLVAKSGSWGT